MYLTLTCEMGRLLGFGTLSFCLCQGKYKEDVSFLLCFTYFLSTPLISYHLFLLTFFLSFPAPHLLTLHLETNISLNFPDYPWIHSAAQAGLELGVLPTFLLRTWDDTPAPPSPARDISKSLKPRSGQAMLSPKAPGAMSPAVPLSFWVADIRGHPLVCSHLPAVTQSPHPIVSSLYVTLLGTLWLK